LLILILEVIDKLSNKHAVTLHKVGMLGLIFYKHRWSRYKLIVSLKRLAFFKEKINFIWHVTGNAASQKELIHSLI
jgi:hypothetical protein